MSEDWFWEELAELVAVLRRVAIATAAATAACAALPTPWGTPAMLVLRDMSSRLLPEGALVIPASVWSPLASYVVISLALGMLASSPYAAYEVYRYLKPVTGGCWRAGAALPALFASGCAYGYLVVAPLNLRVLAAFAELLGLAPVYELSSFLDLAAGVVLVTGLAFTAPFWAYVLSKLGLVRGGFLSGRRRYIYGLMVVAISILDPEPLFFTELALGLPLAALLEATNRLLSRGE